jgi:TonB family protein
MKIFNVAILMPCLCAYAIPQVKNTKTACEAIVLQSSSILIEEVTPQKQEKYRRPPMVAYDIREDGSVGRVRIVRRSGIKELDAKLLSAASQWKYRARTGCGAVKVPLAAGAIPDAAAAVKVAEPGLIRIYGARVIQSEKPITATSSGDVWMVGGTLHCSDGQGGTTSICVGGVAAAHLSKDDGRVLNIFHTL